MTGNMKPGRQRTSEGRPGGMLSGAGLGLTLVAVLAIGGLAMARALPATSGAKPTPPGSPIVSGQASPPESAPPGSDAVQSPSPTAQPSLGVRGVLPGPDATLPPDARPAIPGLRIGALAAAAESEGLTCESDAGADIDLAAGYTLGCDGTDRADHAKLGLSASYWTLDAISDIHLYVWSDQPRAAVGPAAAIHLFSIVSGLSVSEIATAWVKGHLDDQACSPSCTWAYGSVHLVLSIGVNGARQLDIYGYDR